MGRGNRATEAAESPPGAAACCTRTLQAGPGALARLAGRRRRSRLPLVPAPFQPVTRAPARPPAAVHRGRPRQRVWPRGAVRVQGPPRPLHRQQDQGLCVWGAAWSQVGKSALLRCLQGHAREPHPGAGARSGRCAGPHRAPLAVAPTRRPAARRPAASQVRLAKEAQLSAYKAIECDPENDVAHHLMGRQAPPLCRLRAAACLPAAGSWGYHGSWAQHSTAQHALYAPAWGCTQTWGSQGGLAQRAAFGSQHPRSPLPDRAKPHAAPLAPRPARPQVAL